MAGVDFCLTTAFELKSLFKKLMQKSNVLFAGCAALLNLLRCKIRETETVAAQVFITRSFEVLRPDLLQALNRLSSTVYVMMILSVAKHPLTVSQIQQRLGGEQ